MSDWCPRNIVLFSDGTGNSSASVWKTNVRRAYEALDLADPEHPEHPRQFAFYDDGVGTSTFRPLALLGGAFGVGLNRNVVELYAFLCRTWQPGDQVYGFGFSRGAFTMRVVVALALNQGLVPYDGDEAKLMRDAQAAYRAYRAERYGPKHPVVRPLRALRDAAIRLRNRAHRRADRGGTDRSGASRDGADHAWADYDPSRNRGRADGADALRVRFLGVWDTVDAFGLPVDELTRAVDVLLYPLTMPDGDLDPRVAKACHALCLDDERRTFHPRLWNERPHAGPGGPKGGVDGANLSTTHIRQERVTQVWFAGVHADVGGGYPDGSLSHVSLKWMLAQASEAGLRFLPRLRAALEALEDESGPLHDSRRGLAGYYRYEPRRVQALCNQPRSLTGRPPITVPRPKIHESVFRRLRVGQDGYAPVGLPPDFAVARLDGSVKPGHAFLGISPEAMRERHDRQEDGWNWVWWRRTAYFATLLATALLLLMPGYAPVEPDAACASRWCFVAPVITGAGTLLPGFAAQWVTTFAANPGTFLLLAFLILLGMRAGTALEGRVRDHLRRVWYGIPATTPRRRPAAADPVSAALRAFPVPEPPGALNRGLRRLRLSAPYLKAKRVLASVLLPAAAFGVAGWLGHGLLSVAAFSARESLGRVCAPSAAPAARAAPGFFRFDTREPCAASGLELESGATYRLQVAIPDRDPWADGGVPAGPNGVQPADVTWRMMLAVPMRRHWGQNWFALTARVGSPGADGTPLRSFLMPEPPGWARAFRASTVYEAQFTAGRDGELFFYVNDAVGLGSARRSYGDNSGSACVRVELIGRRHPAPAAPPPGTAISCSGATATGEGGEPRPFRPVVPG